MAAMAAFYRDTLGMPVHSERPALRCVRVGRDALQHRLALGGAWQERRAAAHHGEFGHFGYHALHERLTAEGVRFVRPPEREHWGGWVATFEDPDGNLLQLLEQP